MKDGLGVTTRVQQRVEALNKEAGVDGVEGVEGDETPGASSIEGKDWLSGKTGWTEKIVPWPRRM